MKSFVAFIAPAALIAVATALIADSGPRPVNPRKLKDRVTASLGEEFTIAFQRDGDRLVQPVKSADKGDKAASVCVTFDVTSAAPGPPPRDGAVRPFLTVENHFKDSLSFRALVRLKGSNEFCELSEAQEMEPLANGDLFQRCWEFDSLVEEVVLYEFKLR